MEFLSLLFAKLLITLLATAGAALVLFGLPGTWFLALLGAGATLLGLPWESVWVLLGAAAVAEALELAGSVLLAKRAGASRSGMWGAFLGSLVGAVAGTPWMPVVGTLLGAGAGAYVGAAWCEMALVGRDDAVSLRAARGALFGVLAGRLVKLWIVGFQLVWLLLGVWKLG